MDQFWTQVQYWEEGLHSLLHQSNGKYKCIRKDVGGPNNAGNILIPISTEQPALTQSTFHPVAPGHATSNTLTGRNTDQVPLAIPKNKPVQTNKFYTSLLIGKQDLTCWTQPYSVTWAKGNGNGMFSSPLRTTLLYLQV